MLPFRPILFIVLALLSDKKCSVYCQNAENGALRPAAKNCPPSQPVTPQLVKSLLTLASANGILPDVLPSIQKIFPEAEQIVQSGSVPTTPVGSHVSPKPSSYIQVGPFNPLPPSNKIVSSNSRPACRNDKPCNPPPNGRLTNPLQVPSQVAINSPVETCGLDLAYNIPSTTESPQVTQIESPIPSTYPQQINQAPGTVQIPVMPPITPYLSEPVFSSPNPQQCNNQLPVTVHIPVMPRITPQRAEPLISSQNPQEIRQVENTLQIPIMPSITPLLAESLVSSPAQQQYNLTPVTVRIPNMPSINPFLAIATPPALLPVENYSQNIYSPVISEVHPSSVFSQAPVLSPAPVEALVAIPSPVAMPSLYSSVGGSQQPFTFEINMQTPSVPEPVIVVSQLPPTSNYAQYDAIPNMYSSPPVIVMEKSRSYMKTLLPILLLGLLDGGGCQSGGGCNGGSNMIPVPYPIPIPTNNPIILGSCQSSSRNTANNDAVNESPEEDQS